MNLEDSFIRNYPIWNSKALNVSFFPKKRDKMKWISEKLQKNLSQENYKDEHTHTPAILIHHNQTAGN